MGTGAQQFEPFFADFPGHKQETRSEMEHVGLESVPIWNAGSIGGGLACVPDVKNFFLYDLSSCLNFSIYFLLFSSFILNIYFFAFLHFLSIIVYITFVAFLLVLLFT